MVYPLEGIKVLDFSIAVAAPFGGMMLADMGAEVIKVERVQGEAQRLGLPAGMDDVLDTSVVEKMPDTASWMAFNRGKKDLAIDIRTDKGKEIILKLAAETDDVKKELIKSDIAAIQAQNEVDKKIAKDLQAKIHTNNGIIQGAGVIKEGVNRNWKMGGTDDYLETGSWLIGIGGMVIAWFQRKRAIESESDKKVANNKYLAHKKGVNKYNLGSEVTPEGKTKLYYAISEERDKLGVA